MRRSVLIFLSLAAAAAQAQQQISDNLAVAVSQDSKLVLGTDTVGGLGNVTLLNRSTGHVFHYGGQHSALGVSNGGVSLFQEPDGTFVTSYGNEQTVVAHSGVNALFVGGPIDSAMDARTGTVDAIGLNGSDIDSYRFNPDASASPLPRGNSETYLLSASGTDFATNAAGGLDAYRNGTFTALPTPGGTPFNLRADQDGFGAIGLAGPNQDLETVRFDGNGASSAIVWDFNDGGSVRAYTDLDNGIGLVRTTGGLYQINAILGSFVPYTLVPHGYSFEGGFSRDLGFIANLSFDQTGFGSTWVLPANPVPEPASSAALGLGLTALAARKRRKA